MKKIYLIRFLKDNIKNRNRYLVNLLVWSIECSKLIGRKDRLFKKFLRINGSIWFEKCSKKMQANLYKKLFSKITYEQKRKVGKNHIVSIFQVTPESWIAWYSIYADQFFIFLLFGFGFRFCDSDFKKWIFTFPFYMTISHILP